MANITELEVQYQKMKAEKTAISQLIIKNQTDRFKENKISEIVYNIRSKKYKDRMQEIDQTLPVFEERLKKGSKNSWLIAKVLDFSREL